MDFSFFFFFFSEKTEMKIFPNKSINNHVDYCDHCDSYEIAEMGKADS